MTRMPNSFQRDQLPFTSQPLQPATPPQHATLARSFDAVAVQYAAARPGYPPALFDAVEELAGQPLAGARVLDVGAGTGIATRLLAERGAWVTAVEPGAAMAAELHAAHPAVPSSAPSAMRCRSPPTRASTSSATHRPGTGPTRPVPSRRR